MRSIRAFSLVLVLAAAACATPRGAAEPALGDFAGPASLALVPADTPYALVILEPPDPVVMDRVLGMFKVSAEQTEANLRKVFGDPESAGAPLRLFMAFMHEMGEARSIAAMEKLGLNPRGRSVFYGLSIYPVARVAIGDVATVRATVLRVIDRAKVQLPEQHRGAQAYWRVDEGDFTYVFAIVGNELVFTVLDRSAVDDALPYVFGERKPRLSLKQSGILEEIASRHGLDRHAIGFFDVTALAGLMLGEKTGLVPLPVHGMLAALAPVCKKDVHRLVELMPRMAFGYDQLDTHTMSMKLAFEMPALVSQALAELARPVPGLTMRPAEPPLLAFGGGIDVSGALALARRTAQAILREPFECPQLLELNQAAKEIEDGLAKGPQPAYFTGLRGVAVTMDEIDATVSPTRIRGGALFIGSGVGDLARLVYTSFNPSGGALAADGRPVALPLAHLGIPGLEQAYLGLRGERAALAVGAGASQRVVALLGAPAPDEAPLVLFGMDFGRLSKSFPAMAVMAEDGAMPGMSGELGFVAYALEADAKLGLALHISMQLH